MEMRLHESNSLNEMNFISHLSDPIKVKEDNKAYNDAIPPGIYNLGKLHIEEEYKESIDQSDDTIKLNS